MEEGIGKRKKSVILDTIHPIMPREPKSLLKYNDNRRAKQEKGVHLLANIV